MVWGIRIVFEAIKLGKWEGNIMVVGKNKTWKNGNGKKYSLPFEIKTDKKNIKWGRGK